MTSNPNLDRDSDGDDGFVLVKSKKSTINNKFTKNKKLLAKTKATTETSSSFVSDESLNELYEKMERIKYKLKHEDQHSYYSKLLLTLEKLLNDFYDKDLNDRDLNVYCYGLGSIDDSISSRYQLALILLLIDDIKLVFKVKVSLFELYDPVFSCLDKTLLKTKYKLQVSEQNLKCMKQVDVNKVTLFYMPHCGKALYNNLLYSNWSFSLLKKLVIFGNSFNTMRTQTLNSVMIKHFSYINDSFLFFDEIKLCNKCDLTNDSFYDLSLHLFNESKFDNYSNKINSVNKKSDDDNESLDMSSSSSTFMTSNPAITTLRLINQLELNYESSKLNKPVYDDLNDQELL